MEGKMNRFMDGNQAETMSGEASNSRNIENSVSLSQQKKYRD